MSRGPFLRDGRTVAAARQLRGNLTDAERLLWKRLRRDGLGTRFRRQHPIGRHVVDFYAPEVRLAVEIDGGQHATTQIRDGLRTRDMLSAGIAVLRFWNNEVMENTAGVLAGIAAVLAHLRSHASPLTPLRNGGGDASPDLGALNLRLSLPDTVA